MRRGPRPAPLPAALRRFAADERGVMTIAGTFIFVMMVLAGGLAIDLARAETERVKLQYTLDRAVLAAASLRPSRHEAQALVDDYLAKAGLGHHAVAVKVDPANSDTQRRVSARAQTPIRSLFLGMVGIDTLAVPAAAEAFEAIRKVEISLVLDLSGSMLEPSDTPGVSRIDALRQPAKTFIATMLADRPDDVSISIVPYHNHVNIGPDLERYFPLAKTHTYSYCPRLSWDAFRTTAMPEGPALPQIAHFNQWAEYVRDPNGYLGSGSNRHRHHDAPGPLTKSICRTDVVPPMVFESNVERLQGMIDALVADGGTSIDQGAKWGLALLDPSVRSRVSQMVRDGFVRGAFEGRPADYDDPGTMKVLVIMSDGRNKQQNDIRDGYRSGPSGVLASHPSFASMDVETRDAYILDDPGDITFWLRDRTNPSRFYEAGTATHGPAPADAVELDFQTLWAIKSVAFVEGFMARRMPGANANYYRRAAYAYFDYRAGRGVPLSTDNLAAICAAAKAHDRPVKIFTIGYLVEEDGAAQLRDCASTPANFYPVSSDLSHAFDQISRVLNRLTLTQ